MVWRLDMPEQMLSTRWRGSNGLRDKGQIALTPLDEGAGGKGTIQKLPKHHTTKIFDLTAR